jgi:RHS repeat-associated protein
MKMRSRVSVLAVIFILCFSLPAFSARPQAGSVSAPPAGQTATLLPSGNWLLAGGQDAKGQPLGTLSLRDAQGNDHQLATSLQLPRKWHTATVLPDGTVLILGGLGADGMVVQRAEIFDPDAQSSQLLGSGGPAARAFHSATLLTDGRVLIAGGVSAIGEPLTGGELWAPRQLTSSMAVGFMITGRCNHSATLLPDGRVLLAGGKDAKGDLLTSGELYDPESQTFAQVANPQSLLAPNAGLAETIATSPEDGATDVVVNAIISMRFSHPLRIDTVNSRTVLLGGPSGTVDAKVVGAEGGMLAFITPNGGLLPGATYSVKLSGAADTNNAIVAFGQFSFTTAADAPASDTWIPGSGWMNNHTTTKWEALPPLQAAPGVTALAGRVLKLDGTPLQHVTLLIGNRKAFSDGTGRFLLANIPSGHNSMMVLGDTANTFTRSYGVYEIGVDIKASVTNILQYTIWMTPLDTAHAIRIPSPTATETVVRTPLLSGLELHIPANAVITDYYGKPVSQITITPVPLNQPPFPLPNVPVPIYFTIQPGSAYIKVTNSEGPKGARLFYPNAYGFPPGSTYNFWNYDPDGKGWYVYGQGSVSTDKSQIIPDPGVVIYEFTGAMVGSPNDAPTSGKPAGQNQNGGDPVDLATGLFSYNKTDLVLPDIIPISLTRSYRTNDNLSRAFGIGTSHNYDMFTVGDTNPYTYQELILPNGSRIRFERISPGTSASDAVYIHTASPTPFYGATIRWNTSGGGWLLTTRDGTVYAFPDSAGSTTPGKQALLSITDRNGNTVKLTRDGNGNLTQVTSPTGRQITLQHDSSNRIVSATDNLGRTVQYTYDGGGRLSTVTDANGGVTTNTYDGNNNLLTITDPRNIVYLTNQYDFNLRVIKQTLADGATYQFAWTASTTWHQNWINLDPGPAPGGGGSLGTPASYTGPAAVFHYCTNCYEGYVALVSQVDVTDPRGYVHRVVFNGQGYVLTDTNALGQPEEQTLTYAYYADNLLKSVTDALGRTTTYDYDFNGNLAVITRLDGTPQAVTTIMRYTNPYAHVSSMTDPLNNSTSFSYDALGNLTAITDPLQHQTTFGNSAGQPVSVTDAMGDTTQLAYDGGDLVGVTDPAGNTTTRFFDNGGRAISSTDPLGRVTRSQYNSLNQILQVTDPIQGATSFSYDGNGNLLTLTDALNHVTTWTYDSMDRVATYTDPLLRQAAFAYDPNGNLISATDRNGQVTTFGYDGLNRRTFVGFGTQVSGGNATYQSTITYTYDAGNRLTQIVDSVAGTITRTYDGLNRLTSETTPQGSISYAYDNLGRRTSMQVAGQPAVGYTWDNASRLTQISQGNSTVGFLYDNANRRTSLTLPNNVAVSYAYDVNSQLTGLSYQAGANLLGNLSYAYDQLGRRTQVSGSFARTGLPQPVTSATYDAANELTSWNGANFSYDFNGNMLSDSVNAFSWNARNQLASLNGIGLQYDALGRRTQNAAGTSFLYDGASSVQELSGSTVTANLLNGGIDEVFSRSDASGTFTPLQDALSSAIALVDSNGNLQASYTYDPFGNTSTTGASANVSQYTGRENEGNGLYYYRARYYSPQLQRFISQDPIGFAGGINLYAYAANNPTTLRDPSGNNPIPIIACLIGAAAGDYGYYEIAGRKATWGGYAGAAVLGCALFLVGPEVLDFMLFPELLGVGADLAAEAELGGGAEVFGNQLPDLLEQEMAEMENAGAGPISPGSAGFPELANSGTMNWAVTESGDLFVGSGEFSHAAIAGGQNVLGAGTADVAVGEGQAFGLHIDAMSGHYLNGATAAQTAQALAAGIKAFAEFGIFF